MVRAREEALFTMSGQRSCFVRLAMARRYSSFLIRYWRLSGGKQRIEIEHIQSGDRLRAPSLATAIAWIERQPVEPAGDSQQAAATEEIGRASCRERV